MRLPALALLSLALAACASAPKQAHAPQPANGGKAQGTAAASTPADARASGSRRVSPYAPAKEDPNTRGHYVAGGLYRPGVADTVPDYIPDVDAIPEPEVVHEPRSRVGNRSPYTVLGRQYQVMDDHAGFVETGMASYYGNKFHGRRTSNQEVYDMYAFTAAHKSLPLPSFARVTNLDNGRSVVVRVNDRGPFHEGRVIDLSYAAAVKLGYRERGTARVEVRALLPGEDAVHRPNDIRVAQAAPAQPAAAQASGMDQLLQALPPAEAVAAAPARASRSSRRDSARARRAAAVQAPASAATTLAAAASVAAASGTPSSTPPPASTPVGNPGAILAGPAAPAQDAHAGSTVSATAAAPQQPNPAGERFTVFQDGRALSADEFDAWMAQRQLRVATGQPTRIAPAATASAAPAPASPAPASVAVTAAPAATSSAIAARPHNPAGTAGSAQHVTLQVASFADQGNAGQALARLLGANIADARLQDADVGGRRIWRLRIGPVDLARALELEAQVAGLGMGKPQRVRE